MEVVKAALVEVVAAACVAEAGQKEAGHGAATEAVLVADARQVCSETKLKTMATRGHFFHQLRMTPSTWPRRRQATFRSKLRKRDKV